MCCPVQRWIEYNRWSDVWVAMVTPSLLCFRSHSLLRMVLNGPVILLTFRSRSNLLGLETSIFPGGYASLLLTQFLAVFQHSLLPGAVDPVSPGVLWDS